MTKTIANDIVRPMTKSEYLHIRIDSQLKASIEKVAKAHGISVAALILITLTKEYPELRKITEDDLT